MSRPKYIPLRSFFEAAEIHLLLPITRKWPASFTYSSPWLPLRRFTLLAPLSRQSPQTDAPTSLIATSEEFKALLLLAHNISDDSEEDKEGQVSSLLEQEKNHIFLTQDITSDTESSKNSTGFLSELSSSSSSNQSQSVKPKPHEEHFKPACGICNHPSESKPMTTIRSKKKFICILRGECLVPKKRWSID